MGGYERTRGIMGGGIANSMNRQTTVWWFALIMCLTGGFIVGGIQGLGWALIAYSAFTSVINIFNSND